jgi:segregation and condensation protein A
MSEPGPPIDTSSETPAAASSGDAYRVQAGTFEGPLDLLLHLVRVNEVDVTDIPIVEITRQYNEYLEMMRELDLEVAGEYLVMASTLIHIKSRMLLPPDPEAAEEEAEDPRTELAQQLIEYQRFKQAAESLQAMDSLRSLVWTREGTVPKEFEGEELIAVELFDLIAAFKKLLGRLGDDARLEFKRDTVSVADKITWLTDLLEEQGSADLLELMAGLPTRMDRIATFLAMLEMMRLKLIVAFQRKLFGDVRLALRTDVDEAPVEGGGES